MTFEQFSEVLNSPAAIAALVLAILWTGAKGAWVYGRVYDKAVEREQARAEEWKDIATGGLSIADKAVAELERKHDV